MKCTLTDEQMASNYVVMYTVPGKTCTQMSEVKVTRSAYCKPDKYTRVAKGQLHGLQIECEYVILN